MRVVFSQVSSISLAFQIYGWFFMGFVGPGSAVAIRVGALGAEVDSVADAPYLLVLGHSHTPGSQSSIPQEFCCLELFWFAGNEVGAGRVKNALNAARAGTFSTLGLWVIIAILLAEPHTQTLLVRIAH